MELRKNQPDYLFETSWEVCNKVGGINTVIATKVPLIQRQFRDNHILIGPDLSRETEGSPYFLEDMNLFKAWRQRLADEGLRIRIGRWKVDGNPITFLVDFSTVIPDKNDIFKNLWEKYKVDSISGQRDYYEPALFGHAAGKAIESFCKYNLTIRDRVVAHFHEWMTGSGVLYLKQYVPQVGTLFTTHATVLGRTLAERGHALYDNLRSFEPSTKAAELSVQARHTLERAAAQNADYFTTVSEITASECEHFLERRPDLVTPNGFLDHFVPKGELFDVKRENGRKKLLDVAAAISRAPIANNALLLINSGRYEFRNKGIDVFIESISQLRLRKDLSREVVAFIMVPANNYGARRDLAAYLSGKEPADSDKSSNRIVTHKLHDSDSDLIYQAIKAAGFTNGPDQKVKLFFVPAYLNGDDGVFNLSYYDLLIGADLTIFPSYYEPWGYTPLESIAFKVPTVTTNLAGIGMWVSKELVQVNDGIDVLSRQVGMDQGLIARIVQKVVDFSHRSAQDIARARENADFVSKIALWENLMKYYQRAFAAVVEKVELRADTYIHNLTTEPLLTITKKPDNKPSWRTVTVLPRMHPVLDGLDRLSRNLWWSWNYEAKEVFEVIDPEIWRESKENPIILLNEVAYDRYLELANDREYVEKFQRVLNRFDEYMAAKTDQNPRIAYFSMEFGLISHLRIYSGGLGVLAGDYLKEASDCNVNMFGVGLFYRYGYFQQQLSIKGEQMHSYQAQNPLELPLTPELNHDGSYKTVEVALPGRIVHARIWRVDVGRIPLYLLDTDCPENNEEDRSLSHNLYGGETEHRLKQEILLGIGGIRLLDRMGVSSDLFHCNEGHAAFISVERLKNYINDNNFTFSESLEIVRASTLFTTHTPVPAGHDSFDEDLLAVYMRHFPEKLRISWDEFMNLGRMHPNDKKERFSMSHLAANTSQEINGVSMLHGEVTKEMFNDMWDGFSKDELHIGFVTNGVHYPTWAGRRWQRLYEKAFGREFLADQSNESQWHKIHQVDDKVIWDLRHAHRAELLDYLKDRLSSNWIQRHVPPKRIIQVKEKLSDKALTFGFARRFATYKRAQLLFSNKERLAKIVNNPHREVQFIFAGKAHPKDKPGQDLIRMIVEISNEPEFTGKVLFLQDYDMELARRLVQGVDIWLNTPTRPLEASGTSGMKAIFNGVMNFSVLDGWWVEGYREDAGWALPLEKTYNNQDFQDELDAETIYSTLENEIIPLFYDRGPDGVPNGWVKRIKNSIAQIAPNFTMKRMIDDYHERFYGKLAARTREMRKDNYRLAKEIASWKKRIFRSWDSIEVVSVNSPNTSNNQLLLGEKYRLEVVLDLKELYRSGIGIEILIAEEDKDGSRNFIEKIPMAQTKMEGQVAHFEADLVINRPGSFSYGIRVHPLNDVLPHRQDFNYVKWL